MTFSLGLMDLFKALTRPVATYQGLSLNSIPLDKVPRVLTVTLLLERYWGLTLPAKNAQHTVLRTAL